MRGFMGGIEAGRWGPVPLGSTSRVCSPCSVTLTGPFPFKLPSPSPQTESLFVYI